ncbi:MAG: T9SS type A sorting domain-containing protein [Bacteroidia bacterium]
MKKILLLAILSVCIQNAFSQYITIPDPNFRIWLNANGFSSCLSGNQLDTTCSAVVSAKTINCSYASISDLNGLQYFDSVTVLSCSYNLLWNLPPLRSELLQLDCYQNNIANLPALPAGLQVLHCENNNLSGLPALPPALQSIYCYGNTITSLPPLPSGLVYLDCSHNSLTGLPSLPATLTQLDCDYNTLAALPMLSSLLSTMDCSHNQLTTFPAFPQTLRTLYCSYNQLSTLPALSDSLRTLDCSHNLITNLPSLNDSLYSMICNYNMLSALPALSARLSYLDCQHNQIVNLLSLPQYITTLYCQDNVIDSITSLPQLLSIFDCSRNQLANLPLLPPVLSNLRCTNNLLITIPGLPASLKYLYCDTNQLNSLPELPDTLVYLNIRSNPDIRCLPEIKTIYTFYWTGGQFACVPNYGTINSAYPAITTLPLCDIFNTDGCRFFWNINGTVYADTNSNCQYDISEPVFSKVKVKLYQGGNLVQETFTNVNGNYDFQTDTGNYTLRVDTALPYLVSCPATGFYSCYVPFVSSLVMNNNFGLICKPGGFDNGVAAIYSDSGIVRPGNYARIHILAGNISGKFGVQCPSNVSGTVQVIIYGNAHYVSASPNALTPVVTGDTLTYIIPDFNVVNFNTDFGITILTHTWAQAFDQICFDVTVNPVTGDYNPSNNHLVNCFTVINSHDPNDKSVYPSKTIDDKDGTLTYNIRFQNTGTGSAQNIYIIDTLDANLDVSTFELLSYSTEPIVQLIGNILRFNFPNINLPDSTTDEPGSNGYVQYSIKLKDSLPLFTTVTNTAYIYFDYNPPVQTNYVADTLLDCDLVVTAINISKTGLCKGDTLFATISLADSAIVNWYLDSILIGAGDFISIPNISLGNHVLKTEVITSYCTKEISTPFTFYNLPAIYLGTDSNTCNLPVPLNAGPGFSNYLWSTGATTQIMVALSSNNYSVIVTDANGCSTFDIINININPLPIVALGNDTTTCNLPVQLDAGAGNTSYLWNNGATTQIVTATSSNNYSVIVSDANGCSNSSSINIVIHPLPLVELGNDTATCNIPVQLNAGIGNTSYQWSTGETTQMITATTSNNFSVIVTDANGCTNSGSILITVNPLPVVSFNAFNQDTICINYGIQNINSGNPPGGNFSGVGVVGNTFDPNVAGPGLHSITYTYTDSLGCTNAASDNIFIDLCLGINLISHSDEIKIYPNPASNSFTVILKNNAAINLEIFDMIGNKVKQLMIGSDNNHLNGTYSVDVSELPSGNYMIKFFEKGNIKVVERLVILKLE